MARGLGVATASNYERVAWQFFSTRPEPLESRLAELTAADVSTFILEQSGRLSVPGAQTVVQGRNPRQGAARRQASVAHGCGESVVDYLRCARPNCSQRHLFIRSCAPLRGLSRQAIGGPVRAASVRAGLNPRGPHRLRHTVATGLLRRSVPLAEIAQLLRHQSVQTTVIYAKAARQDLSSPAHAWPGAVE